MRTRCQAHDPDARPSEQDERGCEHYHRERSRLPEARRQHFENVKRAVDARCSPIIVDDDHGVSRTAKAVIAYALVAGYEIEFAEPSTPWWQAIRPMLADFDANATQLRAWARKLAFLNRSTHRDSMDSILERMRGWHDTLSLAELLSWGETKAQATQPSEQAS